MRNHKESRKILVGGVEYRWRAKGDDGWISIGIWPANNIGAYVHGSLGYHESWVDNGDGSWTSAENQIVITNRIIRRIIEHATMACGYDPEVRGNVLNLQILDDVIHWNDAVRSSRS